jgi:predicted nucleic-acid-binding protein
MRAADTNVLVRLLIGDDVKQTELADAFAEEGVWVSHVVLAETIWVLRSSFRFEYQDLLETVEMLVESPIVTLQDPDVVEAALNHYRQKATPGFTDCLMVEIARKAGHVPVGTFDKALARLPNVQRI